MKVVYHLQPPKAKYSSIWDENKLLVYSEQVKGNCQINLLELSRKVRTLLELLHGLRITTIATFDISLITMSNDTCVLYPYDLLKHDRQ